MTRDRTAGVLLPEVERKKPEPKRETRPELSVIVVSTDRRDTSRCLRALAACVSEVESPDRVEVLIPWFGSDDEKEGQLEEGFPFRCRWLRSGRQTLSSGRNTGISHARGRRVAFLADEVAPQPGWLKAAMECDPDSDVMLAGPESPLSPVGGTARAFSALNNPTVAILWPRCSGRRAALRWYQASLRNLVVPRALIRKAGPFDDGTPEHVSGSSFLLRAGGLGSYAAEPRLRVFTEGSPAGVRDLWDEVFDRGVAGAQGLAGYAEIYGRSRWTMGWAVMPWVVANMLIFVHWFPIVFVVAYLALLVSQIGRLAAQPGSGGWMGGLICLVTAHAALVAGMQIGLLRCLLKWLGRVNPFGS